ncbi:hypothetical protein LXL04_014544 [Taraxacum kok-saghyz]
MSIFKAPQGILDELERIRRSFIWGNEDTKKKIHWVEWSKVIASKKDGGLGVGSIKAQNLALLTKWWWRLINEENSLWKKVVSKIHNLASKPVTYIARRTSAGVWCNIAKAKHNLNDFDIDWQKLFYLIPRSNVKILFWKDVWCGDTNFQVRFPRLFLFEAVKICKLKCRISTTGFSWRWKQSPSSPTELNELLQLYKAIGALDYNNPTSVGFRYKLSDVSNANETG